MKNDSCEETLGHGNCQTKSTYTGRKCLDFKRKVRRYVALEKILCFCFHRKWKVVDSFHVKEYPVWFGRTPWKSWLQTWRRKPKKTTGQMTCKLSPWPGNSSDEMRRDKSYWLQSPPDLLLHAFLSYGLNTYLYYNLITCPNGLKKLTDTFSLFKHKTKLFFSNFC